LELPQPVRPLSHVPSPSGTFSATRPSMHESKTHCSFFRPPFSRALSTSAYSGAVGCIPQLHRVVHAHNTRAPPYRSAPAHSREHLVVSQRRRRRATHGGAGAANRARSRCVALVSLEWVDRLRGVGGSASWSDLLPRLVASRPTCAFVRVAGATRHTHLPASANRLAVQPSHARNAPRPRPPTQLACTPLFR
jgi:hypothetical protein